MSEASRLFRSGGVVAQYSNNRKVKDEETRQSAIRSEQIIRGLRMEKEINDADSDSLRALAVVAQDTALVALRHLDDDSSAFPLPSTDGTTHSEYIRSETALYNLTMALVLTLDALKKSEERVDQLIDETQLDLNTLMPAREEPEPAKTEVTHVNAILAVKSMRDRLGESPQDDEADHENNASSSTANTQAGSNFVSSSAVVRSASPNTRPQSSRVVIH